MVSFQSVVSFPLPPLENGDRVSRDEFERRYQAMSEATKAELIEGVVYMASPLRFQPHAEPHGRLITWLGVYQAATTGIKMGIEPTVRLDTRNEVQPDGVLFISPEKGGQARFTEEGYLEGAPELVVEVAASSASIDLGDKKLAYGRCGVKEYIVWQVFEEKIDWFRWQNQGYVSLVPNQEGIIDSEVFSGLRLDIQGMLEGNLQQVITVLQAGLNSSRHQAFIANLN